MKRMFGGGLRGWMAGILLAGEIAGNAWGGELNEVTGVTCRQRWPWNGLVDIDYTVEGTSPDGAIYGTVTSGGITQYLRTVTGEVTAAAGRHRMTWDSAADWPELNATDVVVRVEIDEAKYCVIDLSGGTEATKYPVRYLAAEPEGGFNTDAYKTTNLVLKLCPSGTFIMGSDQTDENHRVRLTKGFYMGLFEVTQRQWELVTGSNPSKSCGVGNTYPVYYVSYNMIRGSSSGAGWPGSSAVDASSFLGKLRARTGLDFDLPTEAQWEYACRAGTTTTYSYGNSASGDSMWYSSNSSSKTHPVGGKKANPWGLYDMHGNVFEWCLDWYGNLAYGTDPKGSSPGSGRVPRGGGWYSTAGYCASSYRGDGYPSIGFNSGGFRLTRTLPNPSSREAFGASRERAPKAAESGCVSGAFRVEAGAGGVRTVDAGTEVGGIAWSSRWSGGEEAVVKVDGVEIARGAGEGSASWTAEHAGTHVLTHETLPGGETLSVTVEVAPKGWTSNRVTGVTCRQRWPWNGLVDIDYTVEGTSPDGAIYGTVTSGGVTQYLRTVTGEVTAAAGRHRMTWDSAADWPELNATDVVVRVEIGPVREGATYCVIDLSGGTEATKYPVRYLDAEPEGGFNTDAYKTTNLVLKLCPSGTFIMGSDQTDENHRVRLTKGFYMGLFEVTQRQWELVTGSNPCSSTSYGKGNTYPVHYVSYNMIRGSSSGAGWPGSSAVDASSFLGKLRARTGVDFDLPTEAQWEYACRAGTTTTYSYGNSANGDFMWYSSNSSSTAHPVGGKKANPWGLYDLHGNVWEWCLDWHGTLAYGTDPKGSSPGSARVGRGGCWYYDADYCASSYRDKYNPSGEYGGGGFRLTRTLPNPSSREAFGVPRERAPKAAEAGCVSATFRVEADVGSGVKTWETGKEASGVTWSALWGGGEEAVVSVNGAELASGTGEGDVDWTPEHAGTYVLTHETLAGGGRIGEVLTATFVVLKGTQAIEFPEIGAQLATNEVELSATAGSGLPVGFAVAEGPGAIADGVLTFTGPGTVWVTASQAGNADWLAAPSVSNRVEVSAVPTEILFTGLAQTYDGAGHEAGVETDPAGVATEVRYGGGTEPPVNAGTYEVTAWTADARYEGAATGTLTVAKAAQTIDFPAIGGMTVTNEVALEATAGSGLAVEFAVAEGPGAIGDGVLRFTGMGTVVVVASQGGDGNWEAAGSVTQSVAVAKATAEVTLAGLAQTYDGTERVVTAGTVPEGLTVNVTYDGNAEAPVDAGTYAVSAVVEDALWRGGTTGLLTVAKAAQSIDFPAIGGMTVTNEVALEATAGSGLAVEFAVAEGPGAIGDGVLRFTGVGTVVVVASQGGDGNWEAAESVTQSVEVTGFLTLTVESAHGTSEPAAGAHEEVIGTEVTARLEGSPAALREGVRAVCTGWRLEGNDPVEGTGTMATFRLTNAATLRWQWETQALVEVEARAHGTATGGGWYALGATATLTATPDAGHPFTGWEGDVPKESAGANPVRIAVTGPGVAVATFHTTYYASGTGDDGADGLGWGTAKREIASALAEAADGDTVVATNGTYRGVRVPEGVRVRSATGAEGTVIRATGGGRGAELGAGATLEGFTVTGADTDGDGAGVRMSAGARTERCVLTGNRTTGTGGGAWGGTLVNCLVTGNEAGMGGGGAAEARVRHCTVSGNRGGGTKACDGENSIVWGNADGDAEGGAWTWSCTRPLAAGAGNLEEDPLFAGGGDWRLTFDSPCVNAGTESDVSVDLDGAPRPQPKMYGGELAADMGCYEYVLKARYVWSEGSGTAPYETWATAATNIQDALDASTGGDLVLVEAGRYGAVTMSNAVVLSGLRGEEATVIDGGGAGRAVTMEAGGVLEGFTVTGGASEDCGGVLADGGATVRNVRVEGNRTTGSEGFGGGVCLWGASTAENVTATGNEAGYGAGVYATETSAVRRCTLEENAAGVWGGGAYLEDGSTMEACLAEGNTAVRGAGLYATEAEVEWSTLRGNAATGTGGGAYLSEGTFHNNTVEGNTADSGAGVYAKDAGGHDCVVAGNEAKRSGGGAVLEGESAFWNLTVAENRSGGAGVWLKGRGQLGNSIVWGNTGSNLAAEATADVRYSCVEPAAAGEGNFAGDPGFAGAGDYHLRADSACVDAGENQDWMPAEADMDGQRRLGCGIEGVDQQVDVGADEAALDAVRGPRKGDAAWMWRVVPGATLQLQGTGNLRDAGSWTNAGGRFTATNGMWRLEEAFEGRRLQAWRLIWVK